MTMHDRGLAPTPFERTVNFRSDIATLSGTLFVPGRPPKSAIVLHGATGVPHRFYAAFARWLAGQGYAVLTYDYRGFGASHGARASATMAVWGLGDQSAAQALMEREFPAAPFWIIGHSFGALMLPFQPGAQRVKRLIAVASGPVHFSDHPIRMKAGAVLLWHVLGPMSVALTGKLSGRILGGTSDVPAGVFWQWRRWCTTRGFHLGDVGKALPVPDFAGFRGKARTVAISDDDMVPPAAVWRLMQLYPKAQHEQHVVTPRDLGLKRIGHIAAFHPRNSAAWPGILGQVG